MQIVNHFFFQKMRLVATTPVSSGNHENPKLNFSNQPNNHKAMPMQPCSVTTLM